MGISRNTVTKYLNIIEDCQNGNIEEIISLNQNPQRTKSALSDAVVNKIHTYLEENQKRPKKQRLNAHQIFQALRYNGTEISYSTVKREVRRWKQNNVFRDVCIAQDYESGYRAECDWAAVYLRIKEKQSKYHLIIVVLNNSLYRFARVYPNESQTNLFHALIAWFHEIGGVPETIFFDNMKTVVNDAGEKVFNERFLQFASHYGFQTNACNPASPQEKGTVEKSVSVARTAAFGYRDSFSSLKEANEYLGSVLSTINSSPVSHRDLVPIEGLEREKVSFLSLPSMDFCPYDLKYRKVDR
jgi:transposase